MARKNLLTLAAKVDKAEDSLRTTSKMSPKLKEVQYIRDSAQRNLAEELIRIKDGWYNVVRSK